MELYPHLQRGAAETARLVREIPGEGLGRPTPCDDFDLRTLLNHLVLWTAYSFERRARSEKVPEELIARDFVAEPGWEKAYEEQLDRALTAWSDPKVWEGEVDTGAGTMPANDIASMILLEMVLHGWDLARATGQELRLDEETAAVAADVVEKYGEMFRQYDGFKPALDVPEGASTIDRALLRSGRDPEWVAPNA